MAVGVADAAGGDHRQPQPAGELGQRAVAVLLVAQLVALQLDGEPAGEDRTEVLELAPGRVEAAVGEPLGEHALAASGQAVEALGVPHLLPAGAAAPLGRSRGRGDQAAQVLVAAAILGQQGQTGQRSTWRGRSAPGRGDPGISISVSRSPVER